MVLHSCLDVLYGDGLLEFTNKYDYGEYNNVTMVLGLCAELYLVIDVVLLREEFMESVVEQTWSWGDSKRKIVGSM